MADQIKLQIITPHREVLSTDTPWVVLPGSEGELGILPHHIGLVTTLGSGILKFGAGEKTTAVAVHYGYAQVHEDQVTVLAEMAETASDVDLARATNAEQKARGELNRALGEQSAEETRMQKYEGKLRRSLVRQQLATFEKTN
jgi:F-type H+-transporting ATPase subunit epsilon